MACSFDGPKVLALAIRRVATWPRCSVIPLLNMYALLNYLSFIIMLTFDLTIEIAHHPDRSHQ